MNTDGTIKYNGVSNFAHAFSDHTFESASEIVGAEKVIEWIWQIWGNCPERGKKYVYRIGDRVLHYSHVEHLWIDALMATGYDYKRTFSMSPSEVIDLLNL